LQGVAELLSPRAQASGVEIAWAVSRGAPRLLADDGRLRQVLFNLAGNAVKMTALHQTERSPSDDLPVRKGGVLIQGVARPLFGDQVRLRLSVRDSGPGVSSAIKAHIFEEFTQDAAGVRAGGAGLGLAIVRRIAEALGAEVGVNNLRNGPEDYWGAEFWLEADFPLAPGARAEMSASLASGPAGPLSGRTIAVISECPVVREAALAQIRASGARAVLTSGFEALERRHDMVLVDPSGSGALEAPPRGVKALVLLAPEERAQIDRYRAAGYCGYLIKPLRRASIIARVEAALDLAPEPESAATDPRRDDERDSAVKPGAGMRVLLAEDNAVNALLATSLLKRAGCEVSRVGNGEEACEAALSAHFDLVLMDVRMPVLDGIEATRRLRAAGCETPIAALTANAFEDDKKACLEAGMNAFLTKPIAPAALNALIADHSHAANRARPGGARRRKVAKA
jgi:CheY-like chemotaxis protein